MPSLSFRVLVQPYHAAVFSGIFRKPGFRAFLAEMRKSGPRLIGKYTGGQLLSLSRTKIFLCVVGFDQIEVVTLSRDSIQSSGVRGVEYAVFPITLSLKNNVIPEVRNIVLEGNGADHNAAVHGFVPDPDVGSQHIDAARRQNAVRQGEHMLPHGPPDARALLREAPDCGFLEVVTVPVCQKNQLQVILKRLYALV